MSGIGPENSDQTLKGTHNQSSIQNKFFWQKIHSLVFAESVNQNVICWINYYHFQKAITYTPMSSYKKQYDHQNIKYFTNIFIGTKGFLHVFFVKVQVLFNIKTYKYWLYNIFLDLHEIIECIK